MAAKLKTGKQIITLEPYLLFFQAQGALLNIIVKNENLLLNFSILFGNLCREYYITEKKIHE